MLSCNKLLRIVKMKRGVRYIRAKRMPEFRPQPLKGTRPRLLQMKQF